MLARAVAGIVSQPSFVVVAIGGGLVGGALGGGISAAAIAIGSMLMARRSSRAGMLFPSISRLCATIACRHGSLFCDADLTGAIFDHAQLIACDFRGACLDRARLDRA
ncbi:MAG TPA: pentapeptide repeat-containing protein, partial [Kofleriaceae bacterium]|nr:pentapeptide repeat-containing protein [Kofleriaceae bacterium]